MSKRSRLAARPNSAPSLPAASSWTSSIGSWVTPNAPMRLESVVTAGQSGVRSRKFGVVQNRVAGVDGYG
jgi:hypothetical protein